MVESGGDMDFDFELDSFLLCFLKILLVLINIIYFVVMFIFYNFLVLIEEDFRLFMIVKVWVGELGCWVGDGIELVYEGLEKVWIEKKGWDKRWLGICM